MSDKAEQLLNAATCELRAAIDEFYKKHHKLRVGEGTWASVNANGVLIKIAVVRTRADRTRLSWA